MKSGAAAPRSHASPADAPSTSLETLQQMLVEATAASLRAPVAGLKIEPHHLAVTYRRGIRARTDHTPGVSRLWSALSSHLWYVRLPVAIADLERARAVIGNITPPAGIESCLAAPILGPGRRFLGALCVADDRVRDWSDDEVKRLESLAARAGEEIQRRIEEGPARAATEHSTGVVDALAAATDAMASATSDLLGRGPVPREEVAEELNAALRELRATAQGLQAVNEELVASRHIIEMERENYRDIFDHVPYPYLATNAEGVIQEANEAAAIFLDTRVSLLVGKPVEAFVEPRERPELRKRLGQLAGGGRTEWGVTLTPRRSSTRAMHCVATSAREGDAVQRVYLLLREADEPESPRAHAPDHGDGLAPNGAHGAEGSQARSADFERLMARAVPSRDLPITTQLRALIAGAVDVGTLRAGQRLPSIRAVAEKFGVTPYAALQAYATLEAEGVVERRERSGIYIAPMDWPAPPSLPETADWLSTVLTQACDHQLRIPQLPDLIRRWTASVPVRCVCVDSCPDTAAALAYELSNRFGVEATVASMDEILTTSALPRRLATLPPAVREAQLLVTTPFQASDIRGFAAAVGKPVLVATINPGIVAAVEAHVRERELVVISTGPVFGERIRGLHGGIYRDRIRTVLAHEVDQAGVDLSQPALVTHAARQQLAGRPLRLVAPPFPFFSLEFARKVATVLLRLNLDAGKA